jgi:hypothetical protein
VSLKHSHYDACDEDHHDRDKQEGGDLRHGSEHLGHGNSASFLSSQDSVSVSALLMSLSPRAPSASRPRVRGPRWFPTVHESGGIDWRNPQMRYVRRRRSTNFWTNDAAVGPAQDQQVTEEGPGRWGDLPGQGPSLQSGS